MLPKHREMPDPKIVAGVSLGGTIPWLFYASVTTGWQMVLCPVPGAVWSTQLSSLPFLSFMGAVTQGPPGLVWMLRDCSRSSLLSGILWGRHRTRWGKYKFGPRSAMTCNWCHKPWGHFISAKGSLEEYMAYLLQAVDVEALETEVWALGVYKRR